MTLNEVAASGSPWLRLCHTPTAQHQHCNRGRHHPGHLHLPSLPSLPLELFLLFCV